MIHNRRAMTASLLASTLGLLLLAGDTSAQDRGNPNFFINVMPNVSFTGIDGFQTLNGAKLFIGDVELETSFAGWAEVGKGRWRGIAYVRTSSLAGTGELEGGTVPPGTMVDYDFSQTMVEIVGSAQIGTFRSSDAFSVYAGLRLVDQEQKILDGPDPGTFSA